MSNPAENYERKMVPVLFGPCVPWMLEAVAPQPGDRILDLACGTGIVAREVARQVGNDSRVVGVDINPGMIRIARACAEREGLKIEWQEGAADALPFPDGSFDLLYCQHGLQMFPKKPEALAEMRRVLREDGRMALSVWRSLEHHPFLSRFNEVLTRHLGVPALATPFSLGDEERLRSLVIEAGFPEMEIETRSVTARFPDPEKYVPMQVDVIAAAIPSAQHLDAEARAKLSQAIETEMSGPIREATQGEYLVIPSTGYVVRGRR